MAGKLNVPDYICRSYRLIFNASGVVPFIIGLPRTLPWLLDFDAYSVIHQDYQGCYCGYWILTPKASFARITKDVTVAIGF